MDNLENRTGKVIVKSTFKSNFDIKNCLIINPFDIRECESMHHVETALTLIKELDEGSSLIYKGIISDYRSIRLKAVRAKDNSKLKMIANSHIPILGDVGRSLDTNSFDENKIAILASIDKIIKEHKEDLKDTALNNFKKVNRNRGYDAAEYLVIFEEVIAVESGHVVYNPKIRYQDDLLSLLDCHQEKSDDGYWIMIKNTDEWREDYNKRTQKSLLLSHWATTDDIFHCPDGFPRTGYLQWRSKCESVGLDPDKIRSRHR